MEVISSTNVSKQTDFGYTEESYSMVEQFGVYAVIHFYRQSGLLGISTVEVIMSTTNHNEARTKYKELCAKAKA